MAASAFPWRALLQRKVPVATKQSWKMEGLCCPLPIHLRPPHQLPQPLHGILGDGMARAHDVVQDYAYKIKT
jgi:hypothetical protein